MKANAVLLSAAAVAAALILPGCVVTGSVHERRYDRPYVVEGPPPGYVVVREPPPAVVVQAPPRYAPGPDYVWVPGYYVWQGGGYVLVPGQYVRPPRREAVWVAPRYERSGAEIRFYSGGWH
jgi:hypothetical protein